MSPMTASSFVVNDAPPSVDVAYATQSWPFDVASNVTRTIPAASTVTVVPEVFFLSPDTRDGDDETSTGADHVVPPSTVLEITMTSLLVAPDAPMKNSVHVT